VGQHRRLGDAGGAAGILQEGDVTGLDRDRGAVPPYTLPAGRTLRFEAVVRAGRGLKRPSVAIEPG
jgi:hypothetical protein